MGNMRVTLLGTGISQGIPVIGCKCAACQSTDPHDKRLRTAAVVESDGVRVAIDIGPDFRQQMLRAGVEHLDAILVTHEHSDHIAGLDDVRPFNWVLQGPMPLYAELRVLDALEARFPYAFMPPEKRYPGAPALDVHPVEDLSNSLRIKGLLVKPFRVFHGQLPILGFRFGRFAYITDCSALPSESLEELRGLDTLVINALRHTPHPMHYTLQEALEAIRAIGPRRAYLTHVSHELGPTSEVAPTLPGGVELGYDGLIITV